MLKMSGPIQCRLELVMRVKPKLTKNAVRKNPVVFKDFVKKTLELSLYH